MSDAENDLPALASEDDLVILERSLEHRALDVSNRGIEILQARLEEMTTREVTAAVKESAKIAGHKRQWSQQSGHSVGQGGKLLAEALARVAAAGRKLKLEVEPSPYDVIDVTPKER